MSSHVFFTPTGPQRLHVARQAAANVFSEQKELPNSAHVGHISTVFHASTHLSSPHVLVVLITSMLVSVPFAVSFAASFAVVEDSSCVSATKLLGEQTPHVSGHSSLNQEAVLPVQYLLHCEHCSQRPVISLKVLTQTLSAQVCGDASHVLHVLWQCCFARPPLYVHAWLCVHVPSSITFAYSAQPSPSLSFQLGSSRQLLSSPSPSAFPSGFAGGDEGAGVGGGGVLLAFPGDLPSPDLLTCGAGDPTLSPTVLFGAGNENGESIGSTVVAHSPHETGQRSFPTEEPPFVS